MRSAIVMALALAMVLVHIVSNVSDGGETLRQSGDGIAHGNRDPSVRAEDALHNQQGTAVGWGELTDRGQHAVDAAPRRPPWMPWCSAARKPATSLA